MSFLHPSSLLWLLLGLVIAAFYLVHRIRRQRSVSTMLFWHRTFARRNLWQRWRHTVSLVAQLVLLALLVIVLAEPYWSSSWRNARQVVVIVDTSASMNATDVQPSRLGRACQDAMQLVDGLRTYETMAVLTVGGMVRVHSGFTSDQQTLETAIRAIRPSDGGDQMKTAIELARRMAQAHRNPKIYVLSDGCFADAAELLSGTNVELIPPRESEPTPPENVGITQLAGRPSLIEPGAIEVFVEVTNSSARAVSTVVSLEHNGQKLRAEPLELRPDETSRNVFTVEVAGGGLLTVNLPHEDHLRADDQASLVVPPQDKVAMSVATASPSSDRNDPNRRLVTALQQLPWADVNEAPRNNTSDSVAIHVFGEDLPEKLPTGEVLAVGSRRNCDLWEYEGLVEGQLIVPDGMGPAIPLLENVDLHTVVIESLVKVRYREEPDMVVRTEDGHAVLSAWNQTSRRVVLLHTPLDKTDLTLRRDFPILVANLARWLVAGQTPDIPSLSTSNVIRISPDLAEQDGQLTSPSGRTFAISAGQTRLGPLDEVGIWRLGNSEGKATDVISANLTSAPESNLRRPATLPIGGPAAEEVGTSKLLWPYFLVLVIFLLAAEWLLLGRHTSEST